MLIEQVVHGLAIVEEILKDSLQLVTVVEVRRKPVDVHQHVDEGHAG